MSKLKDGSIDVIVTSPPYNLGIDYNTYDDARQPSDYLRWSGDWASHALRVLKQDGSLFLNVGSKPSDPIFPFDVQRTIVGKGFRLQNVFHWVKSIAIQHEDVGDYPNINGNIGVGHFKPINSERFVNGCHEYIFHLTKHGDVSLDRLSIGVEYQDKSNISRWKRSSGSDLRCRGNTWFVPYKTIRNRDRQRPHPATFPVKIPEMCIKLHGRTHESVVLDPFLGIGSSAIAAKNLKSNFIGFEIDDFYFQESIDRLKECDSNSGLPGETVPQRITTPRSAQRTLTSN